VSILLVMHCLDYRGSCGLEEHKLQSGRLWVSVRFLFGVVFRLMPHKHILLRVVPVS